MTTDKDSFLKITATDAEGIALQKEVIDALNSVDEEMNEIDKVCQYSEEVMDRLGARPLDYEKFCRERDAVFAAEAAKRLAKKNRD